MELSTPNTLTALPTDVLMLIIISARRREQHDLATLYSLSYTCWRLRRLMLMRRQEIITAYMYTEIGWLTGGTYHKFAGLYHSNGDDAAIVYQDGDRIWCRYGRPQRHGGLPHRDDNKGALLWCNPSACGGDARTWLWSTRPAAPYTPGHCSSCAGCRRMHEP